MKDKMRNNVKIPLAAIIILILLVIGGAFELLGLPLYILDKGYLTESTAGIIGEIIMSISKISFIPLGILFLMKNEKGLMISGALKLFLAGMTIFTFWGNVNPQFHEYISLEAAELSSRFGRMIVLLISWGIITLIIRYFNTSKIRNIFVKDYFKETPPGQIFRDYSVEENILIYVKDYLEIKVYAPVYDSYKLKESLGWVAIKIDGEIITNIGVSDDLEKMKQGLSAKKITNNILITDSDKKYCEFLITEFLITNKKAYYFINRKNYSFFVNELKKILTEQSKQSGHITILQGECEEGNIKILINFGELSGYTYEGSFKEGNAHGFGILTAPDGFEIKGNFWKGFLVEIIGAIETSPDFPDYLDNFSLISKYL